MDKGDERRAVAPQASVLPRLLDLHGTAAYLSLSDWTVRALEFNGILPRVRVPVNEQKDMRKLLFDRLDLDRLVDSWKHRVISV